MANGSLTIDARAARARSARTLCAPTSSIASSRYRQFFYTTGIPVCLWFLDRDKASSGERDRRGETLFIDARQMGQKISRTQIELTDEEMARIAATYHAWRGTTRRRLHAMSRASARAATLAEIEAAGFALSPGRYVGAPRVEEDEVAFEERMATLVDQLAEEMAENERLTTEVMRRSELGL